MTALLLQEKREDKAKPSNGCARELVLASCAEWTDCSTLSEKDGKPRATSWQINIGGNGGVPGCDSIRPCCWLFKGNVSHHDQSGAKLNGVASGFKRGPSQPQPVPPRRELPAPSWDPYLPALCGSTSGFGNTIELNDGTLVTPSSYDNASLSTGLWDSVGPSMDGIGDGCGASQVRVMRWRLPAPAGDDS